MRHTMGSLFAEGARPVGIFTNTGNPEMVELAAQAGFKFVIIDQEHGSWGVESAAHLIRAAESFGAAALVRVPNIDETAIKYALDCGAAGVVVPGVSSVADAQLALAYSKFAPLGRRGACPYVRANGYVGANSEYFAQANRETAVVMLIEGKAGVEAYDDIIGLDGVDYVFFGPYDLSVSLGIPGQIDDPRVTGAIVEMIAKARAKGVRTGMLGLDAADSNAWFDAGIDYIAAVGDMALFYRACREMVTGIAPQYAHASA